jgi:hypothetical protein
MNTQMYYEVTIQLSVGFKRDGSDKFQNETYLVDAQSVVEAESKIIQDFTNSGVTLSYQVKSIRKSKILRLIE